MLILIFLRSIFFCWTHNSYTFIYTPKLEDRKNGFFSFIYLFDFIYLQYTHTQAICRWVGTDERRWRQHTMIVRLGHSISSHNTHTMCLCHVYIDSSTTNTHTHTIKFRASFSILVYMFYPFDLAQTKTKKKKANERTNKKKTLYMPNDRIWNKMQKWNTTTTKNQLTTNSIFKKKPWIFFFLAPKEHFGFLCLFQLIFYWCFHRCGSFLYV